MPDDALIVPMLLTSGSLQFATVVGSATVQDVTDTLLQEPEVSLEVLGDLQDYGWALQKIRREPNGRQWAEEELEELGNGAAMHHMFLLTCLMILRDCPSVEFCHDSAERIPICRSFRPSLLGLSLDITSAYSGATTRIPPSIPDTHL